MTPSLKDSARYRGFVNDRDKALERIHQNTDIDISRITFEALENIERLAMMLATKADGPMVQAHVIFQRFEAGVTDILSKTFPVLLKRLLTARRATFLLTYASEQEAIGRATQKVAPRLGRDEFKGKIAAALAAPTLMGPLDRRVWHSLMVLRQRLCSAFLSSVLTKNPKPHDIGARVKAAFPPIRVYSRPPRALTKVRESKGSTPAPTQGEWFNFDFMDESDWDLAVQAYKATALPPNRFDNSASWDRETGTMRYEWELEQEVTEDFVRTARDGQVQAARDLGVQDFVWVAIIDGKTCEDCCLPRNGKTTREIEQLDDDCDATVPPAHFNCRCQVSPVASVDEVQGPDWKGFNEWLET